MSGLVSLVGAGPGDPELLTLRAARRLGEADVVFHDALVSPEALRHARRARLVYVGKRAGQESMRQETINRLLVRAARRGLRVVRLKCGDPFVLGRGGEEALALAEAGVPFEVVPGVTSAVAGPGLAGIPVTHRGLASGFVVVSGHAEAAYGPILRALPPGSATVVVLMGLANRAGIAAALLESGWGPSVPAAVVLGASTSAAATWVGDLAGLGGAPLPVQAWDAPGLIVVGEVVGLRERIAEVEHPSTSSGRGEYEYEEGAARTSVMERTGARSATWGGERSEQRGGGGVRGASPLPE